MELPVAVTKRPPRVERLRCGCSEPGNDLGESRRDRTNGWLPVCGGCTHPPRSTACRARNALKTATAIERDQSYGFFRNCPYAVPADQTPPPQHHRRIPS